MTDILKLHILCFGRSCVCFCFCLSCFLIASSSSAHVILIQNPVQLAVPSFPSPVTVESAGELYRFPRNICYNLTLVLEKINPRVLANVKQSSIRSFICPYPFDCEKRKNIFKIVSSGKPFKSVVFQFFKISF